MAGALSHIRVLDLSRILAGPWSTQWFADMGAEVIKVERPGVGDDTRHWGPPYVTDGDGNPTDRSAYFLAANRGKQSITVDITTPEGQDIIKRLVAKSDVLVENYKVGGLKKYGLDFDSLKSINSGLVYCSITGFGQTGPYANRAGYDFMIQAMGGLMSVTGQPDGTPGAGPVKVGVALADILSGLYAANAIQAALIHKDKTGQGQWVDLSLLDVQVASLANQALNYQITGSSPERMGNAHPNIVPYQAFATHDSHMIVAVGNDGQFSRFATELGHGEWATDERYMTNSDRVENRVALTALIEPAMQSRTTNEWIEAFETQGIPCGPINNIEQVFADPQVRHRKMHLDFDDQTVGVACPVKMSATPPLNDAPAPTLGAHTDDVLENVLGLGPDEIRSLQKKKII